MEAPTAPVVRPRAFPARPWERRAWRDAAAVALGRLGRTEEAFSLKSCGRRAWVRDCEGCGASPAVAVVLSSCGSRLCDWCQRYRANRAARRLARAMTWLDATPPDARSVTLARIALREYRDRADARMEGGRGRPSPTTPMRRDRAARWFHDLRDPMSWRWRSLTLALPWDPSDPSEYSVDALRARLRSLWSHWRHLWTWRLAVDGFAAASVHAEISQGGHVHLHVLYLGPWIDPDSMRTLLVDQFGDERVGRVWVGETYGTHAAAAVEASKYVTKGSGPSSVAWISGAPRDAIHPTVAAAWVVAQSRAQLARQYGRMRDAFAAIKPVTRETQAAETPCRCIACGNELGAPGGAGWRHDWSDAVARRARERWSSILVVGRWRPESPSMDERTAVGVVSVA